MFKASLKNILLISLGIYIVLSGISLIIKKEEPKIISIGYSGLKDGGLRATGRIKIDRGADIYFFGFKKALLTGYVDFDYRTKEQSISSEYILKNCISEDIQWKINYDSAILGYLALLLTVVTVKLLFFNKRSKKLTNQSSQSETSDAGSDD